MSNPVCVAMCAYNAAATVRAALDSLKAQTWRAFDVIVVDDGSTDDTVRIVETYQGAFDKLTVIRQKNGGIGVARNAAVQASDHTWLAFIDADDVWHPAKLACQMDLLKAMPALDCIVTEHREFVHDEELRDDLRRLPSQPCGADILDTLWSQLLRRNFDFHPASVLWRRSTLVEIGGYGMDRNGEDFQPFLMMSMSHRRIGRMPGTLYFARVNPASLSRSSANHYVGAMARVDAIDRILDGSLRADGLTLDDSAVRALHKARQRFIRWALHGVRTGYRVDQFLPMSRPLLARLDSAAVRALEMAKIGGRRFWLGVTR